MFGGKRKTVLKRPAFIVFGLLLLLVLFGILPGCTETSVQEKGRPVKTVLLEETDIPVWLEYFGIIDSEDVKRYSLKASGKIARIHVDKGDRIEKGQILAELDKTDLQLALKASEYTRHKAETAYLDAGTMYEKVQALAEIGAVSERDLDLAKLDREVKEADYRQAQVDYNFKLNMLNDAVLYADMDGYVVDILQKEGEIAAAGYPVIAARCSRQVVNIGLTQKDLSQVKKGTKAMIKSDDQTEILAGGEVTLIDQIPDRESRTYNAQISIDLEENEEESQFYLGSTCRVFLDIGTVKGILIPLSCIQNDGQDYVYLKIEGRALRKNVDILAAEGSSVRVEGLEAGEELVIAGMKNLTEGCLVVQGDIES